MSPVSSEQSPPPVKPTFVRLIKSLENFLFVSILKRDLSSKSIFFHCKIDGIDAILILQKLAFPDEINYWDNLILFGEKGIDPSVNEIQSNDIFSRYIMSIPLERLNEIDATLICPAEKHHFEKYSSVGRKIFIETPELYQNVTVPYLNLKPKDLAWVTNIIEGKSEVENVLYRDPDPEFGFILVIDYKWNKKSLRDLHMLVIANNGKLTCLRDLDEKHLPMLRKIYTECPRVVMEKFAKLNDAETKSDVDLTDDQILMFFHYPPTFYHLHVHLVHMGSPMDGGSQIGRGHLLHDVIANIELKSDYYQKRSIQINMGESSPMLAALQEGKVPETPAV